MVVTLMVFELRIKEGSMMVNGSSHMNSSTFFQRDLILTHKSSNFNGFCPLEKIILPCKLRKIN